MKFLMLMVAVVLIAGLGGLILGASSGTSMGKCREYLLLLGFPLNKGG